MKPLESGTQLGGRSVAGSTIVVDTQFTHKNVTLPAGTYRPILEDPDGVYYEAPQSIIVSGFGAQAATGGIYFRFDNPNKPFYYYNVYSNYGMDRVRKELPSNFSYKKR